MAREEATNYTCFKLAHSTPSHLHVTNVSKFIGPIPSGWLTAHKKRWLRPRTNYHKRQLSFSADEPGASPRLRQVDRWQAESCVTQAVAASTDTSRAFSQATHQYSGLQGHEDDMPPLRNEGSFTISPMQDDNSTRETIVQADLNSDDKLARPEIYQPEARSAGSLPRPLKTFDESRGPDGLDIPISARPANNITRPRTGVSTRESSSVSNVSYATAPETFEEQLALGQESDEEDIEDDARHQPDNALQDDADSRSETSTIRASNHNTMTDLEIAEQIIPQQIVRSTTATSRERETHSDPPSITRSALSSDADSRKSLINRQAPMRTMSVMQTLTGVSPVTHLVRFQDDGTDLAADKSKTDSTTVCHEGRDIDRKVSNRARRRNQGYFNQRMLRNPFRKVEQPGELLRAERMLVRVEASRKGSVPADYSESLAPRVERRTERNWREFIVAARNDEHGRVVLSFHRDRKIPVLAKNVTTAKSSEKFVLDPSYTKANLYSSLDKTIAIWQKSKRCTQIFILRPKTINSSIAWYAFIQTSLGLNPRSIAVISVPNLSLKLRLDLVQSSQSRDTNCHDEAISITSHDDSQGDHSSTKSLDVNEMGQIVASGVALTGEFIVDTLWHMLEGNKQWTTVLDDWKSNERMGLCWRRYDRLEWLHGQNARELIGSWAMQTSHELEFRPKEHYPTEVRLPSGELMQEPCPVEGFLVRLTSSSGRQTRFGKTFYKRLYFSTHDGLLFYANPGQANPPPPPHLHDASADTVEQAIEASPLIFDVDPYPLQDGHIAWLNEDTTPEEACARNATAMSEAKRRMKQLHDSSGFIDLCRVIRIRARHSFDQQNFDLIAAARANGVLPGSATNEVLQAESSLSDDLEDDRVFELVLDTGLVVRVQCFSAATRHAWMDHLSLLVKYWKFRHAADAANYRKLRQANLEALDIDEETEGLVGQYSTKWEVSQCVSEPQIYNFCPMSSCRTIAVRGLLYRKPRVHSTFKKYECLVSHGKMFIYNHMHWDSGGNRRHHIHHSQHQVIDLSECYVYSGNVTSADLVGARETNDREGPGRHALPRRYTDGWTCQDEQETMCFVIWSGRRRMAVRGVDKADSSKDNSVSRLGVPGHSMIYMARCRQERDRWVQVLNNEIERSSAWGSV